MDRGDRYNLSDFNPSDPPKYVPASFGGDRPFFQEIDIFAFWSMKPSSFDFFEPKQVIFDRIFLLINHGPKSNPYRTYIGRDFLT